MSLDDSGSLPSVTFPLGLVCQAKATLKLLVCPLDEPVLWASVCVQTCFNSAPSLQEDKNHVQKHTNSITLRNLPFIQTNCGCHPDKQILLKETVNQSQACFQVLKKKKKRDLRERSGPTRHQHPSTPSQARVSQRFLVSPLGLPRYRGRGDSLASPPSGLPVNP